MATRKRQPTPCRKAHRMGLLGLSLAVMVGLSGCATSKDELMPHGDTTMKELWQGGAASGGESLTQKGLIDARSTLRREVSDGAMVDQRVHYTRTAANEIYSRFARLPNPDIVMYVYPHLAGGEVPVPGYSTVFSLYRQPQYAMPGETARPSVERAQQRRAAR
ncbi:TIGR03751 family conjugal transfer lipoprotein [Halomonas elongata]|uniref:TIGR03751 family conjugal transfer lipoprotein n=1 Tax=Halomonas elongata TaxID=2746 RepID=UPI003D811AC7